MICRSFFLFFFCFISWHSHSMNKGSNDPARGIILSSLVNKAATLIAGHQLPSKESEHISAVHNEEKPHECTHCTKHFSQKGHLKRHISAVHNEEKPHECTHCTKHFSQKSHLTQHISAVHNEEKPYACEECPQTFGLKSNLKRHISAVHFINVVD